MSQILRLANEFLNMDVIFVAEFVGDRYVVRHVETGTNGPIIRVGDSQVLEDTLCKRMIDGSMPPLVRDVPAVRNQLQLPHFPFPIGSYLGVPLKLGDGRLYGTLCAFSFRPKQELDKRELVRLEMAAKLVERMLAVVDEARQ